MSKYNRNGQRKIREIGSKANIPDLGYYIILTDAKETEKNYFIGIKKTIPDEFKRRLVIVTDQIKTENLVSEALYRISIHPQYGEPWIIFDRDEVKNFDDIINNASKNGINVGWSNPCIEIWFNLYFSKAPIYTSSVNCCNAFRKLYTNRTNQDYIKSDKEIYFKLTRYGDELEAIARAKDKLTLYEHDDIIKPSEMYSATTVFKLVEEIRNKINR